MLAAEKKSNNRKYREKKHHYSRSSNANNRVCTHIILIRGSKKRTPCFKRQGKDKGAKEKKNEVKMKRANNQDVKQKEGEKLQIELHVSG